MSRTDNFLLRPIASLAFGLGLCAFSGTIAAAASSSKAFFDLSAGVFPLIVPTALGALPHTRAAMEAGETVTIVAFGSSSTEGKMASSPEHAYPAMLQSALSADLPSAKFTVINRGIGGQDAPEELARLQQDVIAARPQLVIWQVGANGALRDENPDLFRQLVTEGVRRMQAAGIDVVLMDNQRAPRILAASSHTAIERTLRDVAKATGAGLFSRGALMDKWQAEEGAPYARFLASDGLHHNDLGYKCIGEALAESIEANLEQKVLTASR
jgi:lysophospholipase L1-like esterase